MSQPRGQQPAAADDQTPALLALSESSEPFIQMMTGTRAKFMAAGWQKGHAEEATLLLWKFALIANDPNTATPQAEA